MKINFLRGNKIVQNVGLLILFLGCSYIYVIFPWKLHEIFWGADLPFHLERLEQIYRVSLQGTLFSDIATASFGKIGQAVNIFYPWFNLIPYAGIRNIVTNPIDAYYFYMLLEQFLGLTIAFYASLPLLKDKKKSLLFAFLWRFSTICLGNDFARADIGEAWASIFIPLVILGVYFILVGKQKKNLIYGFLNMTSGLILMTYCHILTPFLAIITIIFIYMLTIVKQDKRLARFITFVASGITYILGTLVIFVPIIKTYSENQILMPVNIMANYNYQFGKNIVRSMINQIITDHILGFFPLFFLVLGIFRLKKVNKKLRLIFVISLIGVILSTNILPWHQLSKTPVNIIQFPWRFLIFCVPLIILFTLAQNLRIANKVLPLIIIVIICSGVFAQYLYRYHTTNYLPNNGVLTNENYQENLYENKMYVGNFTNDQKPTLDYIPSQSKLVMSKIYALTIVVDGQEQHLLRKQITSFPDEISYRLQLKKPVESLILPFIIYNPNDYQVRINGKVSQFNVTAQSLLRLKHLTQSNLKINVTYKKPKIYGYFSIISMVTILGLLILNVKILFSKDYWNYVKIRGLGEN